MPCAGPATWYNSLMTIARSLPVLVLCAAQIGNAALAMPLASPERSDASLVIEVQDAAQGRKGTRTYVPEGGAVAVPSDTSKEVSTSEALEQCMNTWDAKTHITKSKWREICQRQLKDREDMYR